MYDCGEAEGAVLERALVILEAHYGADHVEVAKTPTNLGYGYNALGDAVTAKELLEQRALGDPGSAIRRRPRRRGHHEAQLGHSVWQLRDGERGDGGLPGALRAGALAHAKGAATQGRAGRTTMPVLLWNHAGSTAQSWRGCGSRSSAALSVLAWCECDVCDGSSAVTRDRHTRRIHIMRE